MPEPTSTPNPAEAGAPAVPPVEGEVKPGAPAEKMYAVKINGKEESWPESKLIERAQKAEGAEAAMKKAAELDRAFNNFVSSAQDPEKLLGLLQHPSLKYDEEKQEILVTKLMASKSPRVITAVKKWLYENEIAPSLMDPKERELAELKAEKAKRDKDDADRTAKQKETEKTLAVQKAWDNYRVKIGEGLKAAGLPPTESTVARVARYAKLQSQAKKPVDIGDAVARVKADLVKEHEDRYSASEDDKLLDMLPEKLAERIHKAYLKRLRGADPTDPAAPVKDDGKPLTEMLRDIGRGKQVFK